MTCLTDIPDQQTICVISGLTRDSASFGQPREKKAGPWVKPGMTIVQALPSPPLAGLTRPL